MNGPRSRGVGLFDLPGNRSDLVAAEFVPHRAQRGRCRNLDEGRGFERQGTTVALKARRLISRSLAYSPPSAVRVQCAAAAQSANSRARSV